MNRLVLWHGWGMHPAAWNSLAAQLASEHGMTSYAQALPGYAGASAPVAYTLDAVVDGMLDELRHLAEPITLCGWSLGAMLAMHAARRRPEKIGRLILIGATPCFVQDAGWLHGMTPHAFAEFAGALGEDPHAVLKRFITLFNRQDANGRMIVRVLGGVLAEAGLPSIDTLASSLGLLRDIDLRACVSGIAQPVLLLHGANDPLMPLGAAEWLAAMLPQARLEVLPAAAHAPFLSDTARCAALIADAVHA